MGNKHRTYPEKERDSEVKRLRDALKRKDREIDKLKSELRTLEKAFEQNIKFLKGKTAKLDLKELLDGANNNQSVKEIEDDKVFKFKELEDKWRCHKCQEGIMKLIVFSRPDGKHYIRACSNRGKCQNRTEPKEWKEDVEGIK
jgi:ribosomal protein S20